MASLPTPGDDPSLPANNPDSVGTNAFGLRPKIGLILGPAFLLLTLLIAPPEGLSAEGWRTAGVAALMATFWICECIPIPVTALLPLVLFPALELSGIRDAAAPYANPLIFLFLGGFIIALAMQKWSLHRRIALNLITIMGTRPRQVVAGFLVTSALISMWVSNTATALMMLPVAISVSALLTKNKSGHGGFATALLLAVAYGATTGGMATLIGTPPNALLAAYLEESYGFRIGFGQWMLIGIPVTIITLPLVHLTLTRIAFRVDSTPLDGMSELMSSHRAELGSMRFAEKAVAIVFALTALAWILQPVIAGSLPMLTDTTIAIAGAILLFLIPVSAREGVFVMDWESAKALPWDVLLLFGGGLSLAANIQKHGLSDFIGIQFSGLQGVPVILLVAIVCLSILLLTELTSNTATAATFLPLIAGIAISMGHNPLLFLVPTALAASGAYMMPVGTPPNAIVFGSGLVRLPDMAKAGILLNLIMIPIILLVVWLLGPLVFDIQPATLPEWVR